MKPKIAFAMALMGWTTCAPGQQIMLDNYPNSGGSYATSGGQIYEWIGGNLSPFDGVNYDIGCEVYAGTSVGTLSLLGVFYPGSADNGGWPYTCYSAGQFQLNNDTFYTVPGAAAGQTAYIELNIWDYDNPAFGAYHFTSFAAAIAGEDAAAEIIFSNPTSNPGQAVPPQELTGMPSVILNWPPGPPLPGPEPVTLALAGLGVASLLAFRRRS